MDVHLGVGQDLLQGRHRGGVVVVAVGEQQVPHLHPVRLQGGQDALLVVTGIDDRGQVGGLVL